MSTPMSDAGRGRGWRCATALAGALALASLGLSPVNGPSAAEANDDPTAIFAAAFTAYASGNIAVALQRYKRAAELGHLPASWKLARMYESGEGVDRSEALAHETYRAIAERYGSIRPGDRDAVYVASAFVRLGDYARLGVPGHFKPDRVLARRAYFYAASYFGDADAQFELGRMMIEDDGVGPALRNGLRWLKSAADKGDARASAMLGSALYEGRGVTARPVEGLAMMIRAASAVREADREWVAALLDDTLAGASIDTVRAARALATEVVEGST